MRSFLNTDAACKVFEMMIVPMLTYSTLINLQLTRTQQQNLNSSERRANEVIGGSSQRISISKRMKKMLKLEFGKKSFMFQGAKMFNELPILNRNSEILIKQFFNKIV